MVDPSPLTRREFLIRSAFWLGATGLGVALVHFLRPLPYTSLRGFVDLGTPEKYAVPSVTFLAAYHAWLIRNPEGFYALEAVCPHLGCKPDWKKKQQEFKCPCHGSRFGAKGELLSGPSLKPLTTLPLALINQRIHLMLDAEDPSQGQLFLPYSDSV